MRDHIKWKYKNLIILAISLLLLWRFADHPVVISAIAGLSKIGYIGSFITGIFFVSAFTVTPSILVLYRLSDILDPYLIAVSAGLGAVLGDYLIFKFLKDNVFSELRLLFDKMGGSYIKGLLHSPYFLWLSPIIGAFIIASPFPDEIGIGMMGLSKIKTWQFILLSFLLNTAGIFLIITLAKIS